MEINGAGLVLEGGAMRGVFTSGVLDVLLDKELIFNYVIGVSAGACQSFSYVSRQRGRSFRVNLEYVRDPRYLSFRNLLKEKSIFGMDFMFDEIPRKLIPFDYETFDNTSQTVVMVATDCVSGTPAYFYNKDGQDMFLACRASSSMPMLAPAVPINGGFYLDGGVADPIPVQKALKDGNEKVVIVLTRNADYRKSPEKKTVRMIRQLYKDYPQLATAYENRYRKYNDALEHIALLEEQGKAFVIRPRNKITVKRTEKNLKKLQAFYEEGMEEGEKAYPALLAFLQR